MTQRMYNMVVGIAFPAVSCSINFGYVLKELGGLENLRTLFGGKGGYSTRLCSFNLSDDNWGELYINSKTQGHQIELNLSRPEHVNLVGEKVGLKFKQ